MRLKIDGSVDGLDRAAREHLRTRRPADQADLAERVAAIVARVRREGDPALLEYARTLDGAELDALDVPREAWRAAAERLDPGARSALERATGNLERFHRALIPPDVRAEPEPGVVLERRSVPVRRVGVYAPGGRAAYPSSVLMGVVPARAVGVSEVIVCSPPGTDGRVSDAVLAAAWIGGADRLFAVGGAGAIAALAYGTGTIPPVDVVVGPGNRWVNEAKKQVAGEVRIDSPAGPSELLVLADGSAEPTVVARELVAQAEHDPDAAVVLVTPDAALLEGVRTALRAEVARAERKEVVEASLAAHGALLLADGLRAATEFANEYAAEHLLLLVEEPGPALAALRTAGTVFVGAHSSVAFGDYLTGANHVLPTGGRAHAFSGLSSEHFLRSFTVQHVSAAAAERMAADTGALADLEGLPGHAYAARAAGGLA